MPPLEKERKRPALDFLARHVHIKTEGKATDD